MIAVLQEYNFGYFELSVEIVKRFTISKQQSIVRSPTKHCHTQQNF